MRSTQQFLEEAKPLQLKIGNITIPLPVKPFSKGSVGWHASVKIPVTVGEDAVMVQFNLMGTVVGSKDYEDAGIAVAASQERAVAWLAKVNEAKSAAAKKKADRKAAKAALLAQKAAEAAHQAEEAAQQS